MSRKCLGELSKWIEECAALRGELRRRNRRYSALKSKLRSKKTEEKDEVVREVEGTKVELQAAGELPVHRV